MGLNFCSTPASSVDAERAFSVGRRQVNFMQHNTSANTFKAKMALGSWYDQPFFPKIQRLSSVIEKKPASEMFEEFSFDSSSDSE
ncbi:hypothetical protein FA13DRAFT_1624856 [Coprinellus micaceus]|uniref:HAT C-terminal dimerisation domain-containing protein n=1 Tax=Coprinellus micaceus TaxID=71717 RepID=A0A4Y7TMS4_COPMI|nr:hypothetical protein FA13DRAFT_1624856 [Coprinellus micaceus]